jgi:hypothetical protein
MDRPGWIEPGTWRRLALVLEAQPAYGEDALSDLEAVTASWSAERRTWLVVRVAERAGAGVPLPAALMLALGEVLGD